MKSKTAVLLLFVLLGGLLSSCAWMDLGRVSEIDDTPPNRPPVEHVSVAHFKGEGLTSTPQFTVERDWYVYWQTTEEDTPYLIIYDSAGEIYTVSGGTPSGVEFFSDPGTYYIYTIITGPWSILVDYQQSLTTNLFGNTERLE